MLKVVVNCILSMINSIVLILIAIDVNSEKQKFNVRKSILYITFLGVIIFLTSLFELGMIKPILIGVALFAVIKSFLKVNYIRAIFVSLITFFILALADMVVGLVISRAIGLNFIEVKQNIVYYITVNVLVFLLSLLISKIRVLKNKVLSDYDFENKQRLLITLYGLITIIIFSMCYQIIKIVSLSNVELVLIYGGIFLIFYIIITITFFLTNQRLSKQREEYVIKMQENEQLKLYIKIIEDLVEDIKKYKHDINNTLLSLKGYIDKEDIKELSEYFYKEVLQEQRKIDENNISLMKYIKNLGMKGLITTKIEKSRRLGLEVNVEVFEELHNIEIETIDICKILGILLDNAIDASKLSDEKKLYIGFFNEEEDVSIVIANSFKEKPDITKIFQKGYSTKGENRGLGLWIVGEIIEIKYSNLLLNTTIENNMFIHEIHIKNGS